MMKQKSFVMLMIFTLVTLNCSVGDVSPTSPENLLKAFTAAVKADDKAKAEGLCSKEFWNDKRDPGKHFFKQAVKKSFEMKQNDVRANEKKAVVIVDIFRKGKLVDQVFFYAAAEGDQWRLTGVNENKNHIDHYLNGTLPARFDLSGYPGSPELKELGTTLIALAPRLREDAPDTGATSTANEELAGLLVGDPGQTRTNLRLLLKVSHLELGVISTHLVDSIGRGAIVIHDAAGKEKVFIYVSRETNGWKLLRCTTGWLSEESILF